MSAAPVRRPSCSLPALAVRAPANLETRSDTPPPSIRAAIASNPPPSSGARLRDPDRTSAAPSAVEPALAGIDD